MRNQVQGPACLRPPLAGQEFYNLHMCEACPKGRQGMHGHGRWHTACGRTYDGGNKRKYRNEHGQWPLPAKWPLALRCIARCAFVCGFTRTRDTAEWEAFVREFDS